MLFLRDTEDLLGREFGRWTVIGRDIEGSKRKTSWFVRCKCGTETSLSSAELRSGRSKTCRRCMGIDDLTGQIFGYRIVLRSITQEEKRQRGERANLWLVKCSCGKEEFVRGNELRGGGSQKCYSCASTTHGLLVGVPAGPKRLRNYHLATTHGLSVEAYENILFSQRGRCAICERVSSKRLNVDHCHATGKIRGLLCHKCNIAIGMFDDNSRFLKAAIKYLDRGGFDVSQLWKSDEDLIIKRKRRAENGQNIGL